MYLMEWSLMEAEAGRRVRNSRNVAPENLTGIQSQSEIRYRTTSPLRKSDRTATAKQVEILYECFHSASYL